MNFIYFILVNVFVLCFSLNAFDQTAKNLTLLGQYDQAIEMYSAEIEDREQAGDDILPLYNARGDLYFVKENYIDALKDYKYVQAEIGLKKELHKSDFLQSICGSLFCYLYLNENNAAEKEFDTLVNEVTQLGNQIEEVEWIYTSPIYRLYKENIVSKRKRLPCGQLLRTQTLEIPAATPEENCVLQCNGYAVAVAYACSRVPNAFVQALCVGCIFGLEQVCVRCCKGNGFWENCVKSLRRLYHDPTHPDNPAPHPYE